MTRIAHTVRTPEEYDAVMTLREQTGRGADWIAIQLRLPRGTVHNWVYGYTGSPRTAGTGRIAYRELPLPETRRCTKCSKTKARGEFYIRFRKSGMAFLWPQCKECCRAKSQRVRDADRDAHNKRQREQYAERKKRAEERVMLNAEPFLRYIEPVYELLSDHKQRRVREIRKTGRVSYYAASAILTSLGEPEAMRGLYGDV